VPAALSTNICCEIARCFGTDSYCCVVLLLTHQIVVSNHVEE